MFPAFVQRPIGLRARHKPRHFGTNTRTRARGNEAGSRSGCGSIGAPCLHGAYMESLEAQKPPVRWPKCLILLVAHQGLEPRTCGL